MDWRERFKRWAHGVRQFRRQGGGAREVARRRRQIERGQLTASNGLVRGSES